MKDIYDKYRSGLIAENDVSSKLLELGFDVYKPLLDNQIADMVVSKKNKFKKIQIKSGYYLKDRDCYFVSVFRAAGRKKKPYTSNEVDFIIVKCQGIDSFYVFPVDFFYKRFSLNLFPNRKKKFNNIIDKKRDTTAEKYLNAFNQLTK